MKDCQLFLHWAGSTFLDVVHSGWAVRGVLSCDEILRLEETRKRAVGLLSSVCNVCPKGDPEQRETRATGCVAVKRMQCLPEGRPEQRETAVTCDPAGRLLGVASVSAFTPP